jgi:hypothetical protein
MENIVNYAPGAAYGKITMKNIAISFKKGIMSGFPPDNDEKHC